MSLQSPKLSPEEQDFSDKFLHIMKDYHPLQTHWKDSSKHLRLMLSQGPLDIFDISKRPHLFFLAHRLLADSLCAGFGIRYTVHFNLFSGSIIGLGTDEQAMKMLPEIQKKGQLGCFALTERSAGVLSGLIVETTATWDCSKKKFILNTGNEENRKYWISQGLAAEWCVVVASMILPRTKEELSKDMFGKGKGKDKKGKDLSKMKNMGPHAFVIQLRDLETGELKEGIKCEDMGEKTVANDLDNAALTFKNVEMGVDCLLQRYCRVEEVKGDSEIAGMVKYVQTTNERMRIEVIGQRLLTGRLAIAQMSCEGVKKIFASVKKYSDEKKIHPSRDIEYPLSDVPQLKEVFKTGLYKLDRMIKFSSSIEKDLCYCLKKNIVPNRKLVEEIAVAKVKALETAIEVGHKLEQEVGSFVLMRGSGFEHKDVLLCCKFAEGDSRILQQKMVRDSLKWVSELSWNDRIFNHIILGGSSPTPTGPPSSNASSSSDSTVSRRARMIQALKLARRLQNDTKTIMAESNGKKGLEVAGTEAWNKAYKDVYNYADLICNRYIVGRIGAEEVSKL